MNYNNIYINLFKLIKLKGPLYFTLLWIAYQSFIKSKEYIISTTFKLARQLPFVNKEIEKIKNSMNDTFQKSESTITKLPEKYDTLIGENGIRLSGGEKQRLSIARAILKKSPIILLDEATSSLDAETEDKIQKAINFLTKGRTTIVIAHRLSTILNSDKIYVIDNGSINGEGKHNDLMETSSVYKNFYQKQIKKI